MMTVNDGNPSKSLVTCKYVILLSYYILQLFFIPTSIIHWKNKNRNHYAYFSRYICTVSTIYSQAPVIIIFN